MMHLHPEHILFHLLLSRILTVHSYSDYSFNQLVIPSTRPLKVRQITPRISTSIFFHQIFRLKSKLVYPSSIFFAFTGELADCSEYFFQIGTSIFGDRWVREQYETVLIFHYFY